MWSPHHLGFLGCSCLEAYLAPGHGVAQFGFVVNEGHQPYVGLDEERALQHQHIIRLSRQGAFLLGFLDSLDYESLETFQL